MKKLSKKDATHKEWEEARKEEKKGLRTLPEGWVWKTVGDVVTFEYGRGLTQDNRDASGEVPVYGSNGIVGYHSAAIVTKPCLIIGRKGAAGVVHKSDVPCWPIDTTYFAIPPGSVNLSFLYYLFLTIGFSSLDKSTAVPSLNRNDAYAKNIPVPPLREQERIVSRLEELLSDLEAGMAALERVRAGVKRYKVSVLKSACEGELFGDKGKEEGELPKGWMWTALGELAEHVTSGSRGWAKYYAERGDLFIRVGNFNRLTTKIDLTKVAMINAPDTPEAKRTRLKLNDILITITADVGMIGVIDEKIIRQWKNAYINQHVGLVRFSNIEFVPYIALALASELLQNQFKEKQYGATKKGFNLDDLKSLQIPLPSLEEQRQIVAEVERRLELARSVEEAVEIGLKKSARLRQALLKAAFEGRI